MDSNITKKGLTFSEALEELKKGHHIFREGWNGTGLWLELQMPDENSKMTLPYIYLNYPEWSAAYPQGARVPWLASQTDLLAEDWVRTYNLSFELPKED